MALTAHAIHDLHASNVASDCLKKPIAPSSRFFVISGRKKRFERESSVAEPAEAVVPIAVCANALRQRSRGSCNDTPSRPIGERLECDQGALDLLLPCSLICVLRAPLRPENFSLLQRFLHINPAGCRTIRVGMRQCERTVLPLFERKFGNGGVVLGLPRLSRAKVSDTGPSGSGPGISFMRAGPWNCAAIVEADAQLHMNSYGSFEAGGNAHDVRMSLSHGHKVSEQQNA